MNTHSSRYPTLFFLLYWSQVYPLKIVVNLGFVWCGYSHKIAQNCSRPFIKLVLTRNTDSCHLNRATFQAVADTVSTLDNDVVEEIRPGRRENPDNVRRVEFIVTEENFNDLFPRRHKAYTYRRLLQVSFL